MPQQASQSNSAPPLPPGYTLDATAQADSSVPPLPQGYTLDQEQTQQPPRGFLRGLWDTTVGAAKNLAESAFEKPTDGTVFDKAIDAQKAEAGKSLDNAKQGRYSEAAGHGLAAALPLAGPAAAKAGEDIGSGNTGYGLGEASGLIAQVLAPGAIEKAGPPLIRTAGDILTHPYAAPAIGAGVDLAAGGHGLTGVIAGKMLRGGIRSLGERMSEFKQPKPVNPGAPLPEAPDPAMLQARGLFNGTTSPPDPAAGLGNVRSGAIAKSFQDPGASLPETPDPALLKARSLFNGASSPPDPAAGLGTIKQAAAPGQAGSIAESMKPRPSAEVAPGFSRGSLQQMLDQSVGAKKLEPNVPLRQQLDRVTPTSSPAAAKAPSATSGIPEGHAPVQSSALRSYKYDPAANEFHAKYGSADNTVHVFGDVTPEEAQAFEGATSKGQAMQQIKSNHSLVAKIINGKRVAVKPAVSAQ